ncbi:MAG: hypothetical protein JWN76_1738, partial [Chitinophagaceae bacterium]|nr:hypothetical protein [Chitinophagaceae bacterium]
WKNFSTEFKVQLVKARLCRLGFLLQKINKKEVEMYIILIYVLLLLALLIIRAVAKLRKFITRQRRRTALKAGLIVNDFIDVKAFYLQRFKQVASVIYVTELDVNKAFRYMQTVLSAEIIELYQHNHFDFDADDVLFNLNIWVLKDRRMIETGTSYVEILYAQDQYAWAKELAVQLSAFRLERAVTALNHVRITGFMRELELN